MTVEINHHQVEVDGDCTTLAKLLEQERLSGAGQAVAVNNRVVSRKEWDGYRLCDGMKITVIRAVCGG